MVAVQEKNSGSKTTNGKITTSLDTLRRTIGPDWKRPTM